MFQVTWNFKKKFEAPLKKKKVVFLEQNELGDLNFCYGKEIIKCYEYNRHWGQTNADNPSSLEIMGGGFRVRIRDWSGLSAEGV